MESKELTMKWHKFLIRFKENGPKMLVTLNIVAATTGILFAVIIGADTGISVGELLDSSTISQIAVGLAMAGYNKKYYAERAHMFFN